nr:hypothetical protein [Tanacetum cinerariifolium]
MERNKSSTDMMNKRISTKHWLTLMNLTNSYLIHMEILSRLKDVEMIKMKTKNPLLDQTGGQREEGLEKNPSLLVHLLGFHFTDDDKLYKLKEGDFKRLRIQDIEYMLLLLVQGMRVEDLQLGVKSYQKKLNLTRPDTYRSDLKRKKAYTVYSSPRGFINQNKDKKNKLMRIDELHNFSDGTLNDVRIALDDRLKEIQMKYLPQTI